VAFRSLSLLWWLAPLAAGQVLTSQYDNARSGATLHETTLTPANVNAGQFGKIFSFAVDGDVYAQPLFVPGVPVPGKGTHDAIFIATEHNSVYAFDAGAQPAAPLWHVNFPGGTVPATYTGCRFIAPEIGITPTPAIDIATGTIYVLARTRESGHFVQRLHALAITTGVEKFGGPVEIPESGGFDPLRELPRAGLLLVNGSVVIAWGSSCDAGPYHGWVMAYDAQTLARKAVFNTSPQAGESGIWQSDMAPATDEDGNIYVATGNGRFTAAQGGRDYGDSLLKLDAALQVRDFFTPFNEHELNANDDDLGSGAPVVLPKQPGAHPHLVLIGGKDGAMYVIDRDRMGGYHAGDDSHALQRVRFRGGIYSAPAYWNGHVFYLATGEYLTDFPLAGGQLGKPKLGGKRFGNPGATPAVSSNGTRNGIVWLIETKAWNGADRPAVLHAYDAADVERELYNSEINSARDRAGKTLRFTIPTVAQGRVYVNAKGEVDVYGLLAVSR
jgi:hypothetical protein